MWAALAWDTAEDAPGWTLKLITGDIEMSPVQVRWPDAGVPPTLMERYDALAQLGFAVVEGGPEAWAWSEGVGTGGEVLFAGHAQVRPLRAEELGLRHAGPAVGPSAGDVQGA